MTPWRNTAPALRATWLATRLAARFSPRLSGRLATRLWFTPWRLPLSERAVAKQAGWLRRTRPLEIDLGDVRLKSYEAGRGPTVLLVHGWGDSARSMGAFVDPLTDAGFRVLAIDLPGHGQTSGGQTDALEMAAAIRAVAHSAGPLHGVVAHSMGAHATLLAMRDGLRAERALLISPAVFLDSAIGPFAAMFSLSDRTVDGLRAEIERRYGSDVWTDFAAIRFVKDLSIPALIVHDPDDPQVPFSDARALAATWKSARLEAAKDVGHTGILRDPSVVNRGVAFLRDDRSQEVISRTLAGARA